MTEKQKRFCDEYLIDCNATRAYKAVYKNIKNDFKWLSDTKFELQGKKVDIFDTKTWYNWKRDN